MTQNIEGHGRSQRPHLAFLVKSMRGHRSNHLEGHSPSPRALAYAKWPHACWLQTQKNDR